MSSVAQASVLAPATCGELLQGVDAHGPVLVSLPVDLWESVEVSLLDEPGLHVEPDLPRARTALELAVDRVGWKGGACVQLGREVPHSRGMGSSTADVASVLVGVCRAAGADLPAAELVRLMTRVEPSDSSPLAGLWAIDHVAGSRAVRLGDCPSDVWITAVDSGVALDTVDVHRSCGAGPRLPGDILRTTRWDDPSSLARVATESALRNQERLPHVAFDTVRRLAARTGAMGMCVAHSGSLCGVISRGLGAAEEARDALGAQGLEAMVLRMSAPGLRVRVLRPTAGQTRP